MRPTVVRSSNGRETVDEEPGSRRRLVGCQTGSPCIGRLKTAPYLGAILIFSTASVCSSSGRYCGCTGEAFKLPPRQSTQENPGVSHKMSASTCALQCFILFQMILFVLTYPHTVFFNFIIYGFFMNDLLVLTGCGITRSSEVSQTVRLLN